MCADPSWESECSSGSPVCYIDHVVCANGNAYWSNYTSHVLGYNNGGTTPGAMFKYVGFGARQNPSIRAHIALPVHECSRAARLCCAAVRERANKCARPRTYTYQHAPTALRGHARARGKQHRHARTRRHTHTHTQTHFYAYLHASTHTLTHSGNPIRAMALQAFPAPMPAAPKNITSIQEMLLSSSFSDS